MTLLFAAVKEELKIEHNIFFKPHNNSERYLAKQMVGR